MSTNLTQLFARLIVCAVFLPTGARHLFQFEHFSPEEVQRIERMDSRLRDVGKSAEPAKKASLGDAKADDADNRDPDAQRGLCRLALRLDNAHVPQPMIVAWVMAIAELVGAVSALAGFLVRWTTPPLAAIGAFTLWSVVWPDLDRAMPWDWSISQSQMAATWLAGTLLPVSIFLLGAGKPSIDAAMKGGKAAKGGAKKAPAEA